MLRRCAAGEKLGRQFQQVVRGLSALSNRAIATTPQRSENVHRGKLSTPFLKRARLIESKFTPASVRSSSTLVFFGHPPAHSTTCEYKSAYRVV